MSQSPPPSPEEDRRRVIIPSPSPNPNPNPDPDPDSKPPPPPPQPQPQQLRLPLKLRTRTLSSPEVWFKEEEQRTTPKHAALEKMHQRSLSNNTPSPSPPPDYTSLLTDELLLRVFSRLPSSQYSPNSLVCKRWLYLHGRFVQSLKLFDWSFLNSGRIFARFPNLADIDLVHACIKVPRNSGIVVTSKSLSVRVGSSFSPAGFIEEGDLMPSDMVDIGLEMIAKWFPNLRRIAVVGPSEDGLSSVSHQCNTLQELELHGCGDMSLKGVSGCRNLQVVKLIGCVDGFYSSVVSDVGLTILAQGCRRLVKLELCGCEGSYDGIKAIGQCCQMLEELTFSDHRMDGGWLAALSFCANLKTLRLQSCKTIDSSPGLEEHLGSCPTLEQLHLQRCQLRDKLGVKALFLVCESVKDIVLQNCWGLEDEVFGFASVCRRVKLLSLEGCSVLTTLGLEFVILNWKELQSLTVVSCNKIKDSEVTPALASLFSILKELKWRPDSRSLLQASLAGTGVGNKGDRFFKGLKA